MATRLGIILVGVLLVTPSLSANLKDLEPNFERFMIYLNKNYHQHQLPVDDNDKILNKIRSILRVSGISAMQKQKLLFRLGRIHLRRYENNLKTLPLSAGRGSRTHLPKQLVKNLLSAANALRRAIKIDSNRGITNLAIFNLSLTLSRLRNSNAIFYYQKLLQQTANHDLLAYTRLALAEHLFEAGKYQQAILYYQKSVAYRQHNSYPYSVYKLAWSYHNLGKKTHRKSLLSLQLVERLTTNKPQLHQDALDDLSNIWSNYRNVRAAKKYFVNKLARDELYHLTLQRIAEGYHAERQYHRAISSYKSLVEATQYLLNIPNHLQKLLELLFEVGDYQQLVSYLQKIPTQFASKDSLWYQNHKNHPQHKEMLQALNETIYHYGKYLYELGTDPQKKEARKYARNVLQLYLKTFPDSANYLDARFLLAEILFEFGYLERSAHHFLAISSDGDRNDPLTKIAALNAINSLQGLRQGQDPMQEEENNAIEIKYKEAIDNYLHLFPEDRQSKSILLTAARLELKLKNLPKAKMRLQSLIEVFSESIEAEQATELLLSLMVDNKAWKKIISWVTHYQNLKLRLTDRANQLITTNYKLANYRLALQLQEEKKYLASAEQFLNYQKLFTDDKLTDDALFLSGENFYKAQAIDQAINSHSLLLQSYPDSPFAKDALLSLAQTHERTGLFALAANYYYTFARRYPESRFNYQALAKSMHYYFYLNKVDEALQIADYTKKKFRGLPPEFYITLAKIYLKTKQYNKAWHVYQRLIIDGQTIDDKLSDDFFDNLYATGHRDKLLHLKQVLQKTDKNRDFLAKITFRQLLQPLQEFFAIDITNAKQLDTVVKEKQAKLLKLVTEFERVINLGIAKHQIVAYYRIAEMHENFSEMIFSAPTLTSDSQQEIDQYRSKLERVAFPLKNEAIKYYTMAYQKAHQQKIFNNWLLKAYQKIAKLSPETHPQIIEKISPPLYLTHRFNLNKSTKYLLK